MADKFTKYLISGNAQALQMAKSFLTTPMLMYYQKSGSVKVLGKELKTGDEFMAIPLETENCEKSASAEVSENLIISTEGKEYITDNVAPGPEEWTLSGYIPGNKYAELTNLFTPFVRMNTELLWRAFKQGKLLTFKDIDCKIHSPVVIKQLSTSYQADCRNKTPFSMTLKKMEILKTTSSELEIEDNSNPDPASKDGAGADSGTTMATELKPSTLRTLLKKGMAWLDGAL